MKLDLPEEEATFMIRVKLSLGLLIEKKGSFLEIEE